MSVTYSEIKPCPFCGGKCRNKFEGKSYDGKTWIKWNVKVICNKCRSRGKPVITVGLTSTPYVTHWWTGHEESERFKSHYIEFKPYVKCAVDAWNCRSKKLLDDVNNTK